MLSHEKVLQSVQLCDPIFTKTYAYRCFFIEYLQPDRSGVERVLVAICRLYKDTYFDLLEKDGGIRWLNFVCCYDVVKADEL